MLIDYVLIKIKIGIKIKGINVSINYSSLQTQSWHFSTSANHIMISELLLIYISDQKLCI